MSQVPTIQLVCQPKWMHDEFISAEVNVQHSFGLEIPRFNIEDAWWMPQEFAVHLNQSLEANKKHRVSLAAPGPYLLSDTPQKFTQRLVETITVSEAKNAVANGWWKLAEGKSDSFIAKHRESKELVRDIEKSGLPDSTLLQFSPSTLPIQSEYRVFVKSDKAVTASIYLQKAKDGSEVTVYDGAIGDNAVLNDLYGFVEEALSYVAHPGSLVVDVALLDDESFAVLEYNPVWCSAWYNCDMTKVMESILESKKDIEDWPYNPDVSLSDRLARKATLPEAPKKVIIEQPVAKLRKPPVLLGNK